MEVSLSYVVFIRISHAISISGRSVSLSFFPKRYNKYSMNLIFSGCTMKLRNLIFSTWICPPSAKSLGHKSLWKKLGPASHYGPRTRYVSGMYSRNGRKICIRLTEICFVFQLMKIWNSYQCTHVPI